MTNHATVIWSVTDLLRGDYKRSEYRKVILPLRGCSEAGSGSHAIG